jgi:DNA end-binding protein Ku
VRYQSVVPGLGPVDSSEIVKGYEYQKGRYVTVEPDDLEKLRLETTDTIDIAEFVDANDVGLVYVDSPYYLVPDGSLAETGTG